MSSIDVRRLGPHDVEDMRALNRLFAEAFDDPDSYAVEPPSDQYLREKLGMPGLVALVAAIGNEIVGGLVAYDLPKLERPRSEYYLHDLAVTQSRRRMGVATALIGRVQEIAAAAGAWVTFVQADYGDDPAVALYSKLGHREDVMHFDLPLSAAGKAGRSA